MPDTDRTALPRPRASIVVATHARPAFLSDCIASIKGAMAHGDELLVIECCNEAAAELLGRFGRSVLHVAGSHAAKTVKLNTALRLVRSDLVVLTDDDCRVPEDWVDEMTAPFRNPAVGVAFGPVHGLSSLPGNAAGPAVCAGMAPPELWNFAHGASMAVRRSAMLDIGGFDERLGAGTRAGGGEEADVVLRLAARGWGCAIAGGAVVEHLEWRDDKQTRRNLLAYQRGGGVYLGAAARRNPRRSAKPSLLRIGHEAGIWRDHFRNEWTLAPRMSFAFAGGLLRGLALPPRRFLDVPPNRRTTTGPRPRVLWVTAEPPDRNGGGGNIRQAMLIDSLQRRVDITLLLAGQLDDEQIRRSVDAVLELAPPRRRRARGRAERRLHDLSRVLVRRQPAEAVDAARVRRLLRPTLDRIADDFDLVVVQHLSLAPVLPRRRRARWLLEVHNVPSERARQELSGTRGRRRWLLTREAANARRYERRVVASYDSVITVSAEDAEILAGIDFERDGGRVIVVPNGVEISANAPSPLPSEPNIVLPATLNYRPNVLGAVWFCDEVLPLIRAKVPSAQFHLVGRNPVPEIYALTRRPGVEVHPNVAVMAPWLAWARVVVVPLQVGTGTRLKALEAMAAGRPVVGTTIGLEGLDVIDGVQARVLDTPSEMAAAIAELLSDDTKSSSLAHAGHRHVESNFRWEALADRYADALEAKVPRSG